MLISLYPIYGITGEYEDAAQKTAEALYIQTGLNKIVDDNVRKYQERLPPYCKKTLDFIVPVIDTLVKQRVELRYEF